MESKAKGELLRDYNQIKLAGIAGNIAIRKKAEDKYYSNPSVCQFCGKVIELNPNSRPSEIKRKKYCTRSCAAKQNNAKFPKRRVVSSKSLPCVDCGVIMHLKRSRSSGFYIRSFCDNCLHLKKTNNEEISNSTKAEVSSSLIRKHSRKAYKKSGKSYVCFCGYELHVNICHRKAIKDFTVDTKILEINNLDNLVALCPNHHWEMDHGMLKL